MKNFRISIFITLTILAIFYFSPLTSLADPLGYCTYTATGNQVSGYTKAQCDAAPGTWSATSSSQTPSDPNALGDCVYNATGSKASGMTKAQCDAAPGTWTASPNNGVDISPGAQGTDCMPGEILQGGVCVTQDSSTPSSVAPVPTDRLVPCATTKSPAMCGFNDFMTLINTVVKFILFDMALPIAAIMFAYAGFLLVTSGGSTEQKSKAKKIFTNVALGLIIAVAAWLIIHTILLIVGFQTTIGF